MIDEKDQKPEVLWDLSQLRILSRRQNVGVGGGPSRQRVPVNRLESERLALANA